MMLKLPVIGLESYMDDGWPEFKIVKVALENNNFSFDTGQFVMLAMEDFKHWDNTNELKWTPMSISSSHLDKDHLEFCIQIKNTPGFSNHLGKNLKVGDHLLVKDLNGKFVIKDMDKDTVFIATGSGIAPIMGMIRTLAKKGHKKNFKLFFGFRNRNHYLYQKELEQYKKEFPNFELYTTTSRDEGWGGLTGHVQMHLENHRFKNPENIHAYICGNPLMVSEVKALLIKLGFRPENIFREQWV